MNDGSMFSITFYAPLALKDIFYEPLFYFLEWENYFLVLLYNAEKLFVLQLLPYVFFTHYNLKYDLVYK